MKKIKLTQGKYTLVDDEDFVWLNQWKWQARKIGNTYYAVRNPPRNKQKQLIIMMHRLILGLKFGDGKKIDHINHNGLDNQRENLRACTHAQNMQNRISKIGASKYKGICKPKGRKSWLARITTNKKLKHLGCFDNEVDAAICYDEAAKIYYGQFAHTNFGGN